MASLHIGHEILISHLVLHYFRYKMAAEVCQYLRGSCSAQTRWTPCIIHQNDHLIPMMMYMSKNFSHLGFFRKWGKNTFSAVSQPNGQLLIHKRYRNGSKYVGFLILFGREVWSESLCILFCLV